jgi:hypothetical protein
LALLCGVLVVRVLYGTLARTRPGLRLGIPLVFAFASRVGVAIAVGALGQTGVKLRGTDDGAFLTGAERLGHLPLTDAAWRQTGLHEILLALPIRILGDPGDLPLRVMEITFVVAAIALVAAAVYELAGPAAALLAAWILALEPTGLFFSTLLQKEALTMLGEGFVVLGGAIFLVRSWARGAVLMALGLLLVLGARPYAAAFLALGVVLVCCHQAVRRLISARRIVLAGMVCASVVGALLAVTVWSVESGRIDKLQHFQEVGGNAVDGGRANLTLEHVDFTTPSGLAEGIPIRVRDFLLRPYPWEQANLSQRLGSAGTVLTWLLFLAALVGGTLEWRRARAVLPLFGYLLGAVILGYAMTTANAGTGFRHRVHVILLLSALVAIVWADRAPSLWKAVRAPLVRARARLAAGGRLPRARSVRQ